MKIHVTPRHLRLSTAIEQRAVARLGALEEISDRVLSVHLVLGLDSGSEPDARFIASARLALPGPDLHAEERCGDLYAALDAVAAKLARQLRKRKTRLTDHRRARVQRLQESRRRGLALGL